MLKALRFHQPAHPLILLLIGIVCLAPLLLRPSVRIPIAPADMQSEIGKAYLARLPSVTLRIFVNAADGPFALGQSGLRLWEDGTMLGPAQAAHATIREQGGGAYARSAGNLYFSSSDGSDPRSNGRSYVASTEARLHHAVSTLLVLVAFTCFWTGRRGLQNRYSARLAGLAHSMRPPPFSPQTATRFALALAAIVVAFVIAYLAGLQYRTNDDVSERMIAEGITAARDQRQFLLFQHVFLGLVLRALYDVAAAIPWYDLELAISASAGAFLCLFSMLRLCTLRRDFLFCLVMAIGLFTPIFQPLQFTASAITLAGGSFLLLASLSYRPARTRLGFWTACAVILASFLLASLIRREAALLALVAAGPLIGLFGLQERRVPFLLPYAALALAIAIAWWVPVLKQAYYDRSPGWENVFSDATWRSRATEHLQLDLSRADEFRAALAAAGWTENDHRLLTNWLYSDRQLFSSESMQRFVDLAPRLPLPERITAVAQSLAQPESRFRVFTLLCLAPLLLRRSAAAAAVALLSIVSTGASLVLAGVLFKPGLFHLTWPLYAVVASLNAAIIFARSPTEPHDPYGQLEDKAVAAGVLLAVLLFAGWQVHESFRKGADADRMRRQLSHDLAVWPVRQADVVVVWDNNFPYEIWARPFNPIPQVPWRFFHTNQVSVTPLASPVYAQWGTSDIAWAACHIPGVYLVDAGHGYAQPHAHMLATHMKEHYRESVEVARVFAGQALALYSCRPSQAQR